MAAAKPIYGVRKEDEIDLSVVRPTLSSSITQFVRGLRKNDTGAFALFGMAVACVMVPAVSPVMPLVGASLVAYVMSKRYVPVLRVPIQEQWRKNLRQGKQLGNNAGDKEAPNGIFFVGWEIGTGQELWLSNEDAREHFWVIGTTGSGKTELLMAFIINALSWGSGAYMVDGKGDVRTARKFYQICRAMGRDDDFLCINFSPPSKNSGQAGLISNTTNPLASYGQDEIIQMVQGMLPPSGGDSGPWLDKAVGMFSAMVPVLVWLRDNLGLPLSVNDLRHGIQLTTLIKMAGRHDDMYEGVPAELLAPVRSYLLELGLPEEVLDQPGQQPPPEVGNQHSYRMSFFSRPLGSLADGYKHIFGKSSSDLDVFDAVLNRRCVISILPALGKAMSEMENLGRILIATMKVMLGDSLGSQIEGTWSKAVDQRPTSSSSPYIVIFDECSFYIADGMSMLPAQGRSLGFSFVFASQSMQGVFNRNQKEGTEAYGTVNTKIFMKVEDAMATAEQSEKAGGKAFVAKASGYERQSGEFGNSHQLSSGVQVDYAVRNDIRDLRKQWRGQIHLQNGDTIVRGTTFYIDDAEILDKRENIVMRLNHLIPLDEIHQEDEAESKAMETIYAIISTGVMMEQPGFAEGMQPGEIGAVGDTMTIIKENAPNTPIVEATAAAMWFLFQSLSGQDPRQAPAAPSGSSFPGSRRRTDGLAVLPEDVAPATAAPAAPAAPANAEPQRQGRRRGGNIDVTMFENDTMMRTVAAMDQPAGATTTEVDNAVQEAIVRNASPTHTPEPIPEPSPEPQPGFGGAAVQESTPASPQLVVTEGDDEIMAMFTDMFSSDPKARLVGEDEN